MLLRVCTSKTLVAYFFTLQHVPFTCGALPYITAIRVVLLYFQQALRMMILAAIYQNHDIVHRNGVQPRSVASVSQTRGGTCSGPEWTTSGVVAGHSSGGDCGVVACLYSCFFAVSRFFLSSAFGFYSSVAHPSIVHNLFIFNLSFQNDICLRVSLFLCICIHAYTSAGHAGMAYVTVF